MKIMELLARISTPLMLAGMLIYMIWFNKPVVVNPTANTYIYDSTINNLTFSPNIYYPESSKELPIPKDIDTLDLIKKYYTDHFYSDTIIDKDVTIYLKEIIGENRRKWFDMDYKITRPEQIIPPADDPRNKIFVGFKVGAAAGERFSLGPMLHFLNKRDQLYFISHDFINKRTEIGVARLVSVKRKRH